MTPTLPPRRSPVRGFTLIELLVGIVVFTSLISITYSFTAAEIRREEVNSLAIELASWLKVVQNTAQVRPGSTSTTLANGCTITFTGATGNLVVPGSPLASVAPAACSPNAGFNIPTGSSSRRGFRATITGGTGTPPTKWCSLPVARSRPPTTSPFSCASKTLPSSAACAWGPRLVRSVSVPTTMTTRPPTPPATKAASEEGSEP